MNTFGRNFRVTTFGESHGSGLGAVVDGCPPGVVFSEETIRPLLARRRPGQGPLVSPRREMDEPEILSGVFEGVTTGTPVAMLVRNTDVRSGDYSRLQDLYRPGHADYTYEKKYGIRDFRGGGRSSGRETLGRVLAGSLAMAVLAGEGIVIEGKILSVHGATTEDDVHVEILKAKETGDSVGGMIEVIARGVPAGLGDPVFGKLDALIAGALMSIGGVKAVEIGSGMTCAGMCGSEHNDPLTPEGFMSNHAGGILGGISNGDAIVVRAAVKPTPSIEKEQQTISRAGESVKIAIQGRHDPCIVPRILPVAESMLALVLADALLEQRKYRDAICR